MLMAALPETIEVRSLRGAAITLLITALLLMFMVFLEVSTILLLVLLYGNVKMLR